MKIKPQVNTVIHYQRYTTEDLSGKYIIVDDNKLTLTFQKGPLQYNGINGCTIAEAIAAVKGVLEADNAIAYDVKRTNAAHFLQVAIEALA